jgi:hypothetical protein
MQEEEKNAHRYATVVAYCKFVVVHIPADKLIMRTKNASRLQAGRTVECDLLLTYRSYVGLWSLSEECLIFRTFRELAARRQVVVTDRHVM